MNIDQIAPEALRLPARERALLAASLWESIEDAFELAEVAKGSLQFQPQSRIERAVRQPRFMLYVLP